MNVVLLPLNISMIMHLSTFDVLSIYFRYYTYVHVHGARSLDDLIYQSILFAGRRVGDVRVWYQSSGCSMGLNGP